MHAADNDSGRIHTLPGPQAWISDRDLANLTATITIGIYSPARSIIDTYRLRH